MRYLAKAPRGAICLVTNDLDYVVRNSGIGTYFSLTAALLARHGWRVHVLHLGTVDNPEALAQAPGRLAKLGIGFSALGDFDQPPHLRARQIHAPWFVTIAARVRHALEDLHRIHHFDLIEFPDWLGFGFVSIQAKRSAPFLPGTRLCVKLHGTSAWQRDGNRRWISRPDELIADYCERYAFEHADVQMSPSRYMLDYVRAAGWSVHDDAVVSYPYPEPTYEVTAAATVPTELVFFGRLEMRKGLDVFIDALAELDSALPITFLGRDTPLADGESATNYIVRHLPGRQVTLLTDYDRERALEYLSTGDRLAVIASQSETFGFTVAECAVNGIPFIASRAGGIPEVIGDESLNRSVLFAPTPDCLAQRIKLYMQSDADELQYLRKQIQRAVEPASRNEEVVSRYSRLFEAQSANVAIQRWSMPREMAATGTDGPTKRMAPPSSRPRGNVSIRSVENDLSNDDALEPGEPAMIKLPGQVPLVTVAVAYYNLPEYLPDALAALAQQTYANLEVIVVDDGSTGAIAIRVFEEQQRLYPRFRFISQPNGGPGAARNRALSEAHGEFFVTVDADNISRTDMIERFVDGMTRIGNCSALTCYLAAFSGVTNLERGDYEYSYIPTGGPLVAACFNNVFGDTNAIFRTADLRSAGGYETNPNTPCEDWETFIKLVKGGFAIDVIPEPLFDYRLRGNNRSLLMTKSFTDTYSIVQTILKTFFIADERDEFAAAWHVVAGLEEQTRSRQRLEQKVCELSGRLNALQADDIRIQELRNAVAEMDGRRGWMRYRAADKCVAAVRQLPFAHRIIRSMLPACWKALRFVRRHVAGPK